MAQQEDRQTELPEELTEDEATRLDILILEMPPPMPRYTVEVMPPGLSAEEALNLALQYSVPAPLPPLPSWAPAPAPPQAALAYAPPHPSWPWEILNVVNLT
jgi:hypothetical protein